MINIIQETFKAIKLDSQLANGTGFTISTGMPLSELMAFLKSRKIKVSEFDAVVCSSEVKCIIRSLVKKVVNLTLIQIMRLMLSRDGVLMV